jgi:hypothetical protein
MDIGRPQASLVRLAEAGVPGPSSMWAAGPARTRSTSQRVAIMCSAWMRHP